MPIRPTSPSAPAAIVDAAFLRRVYLVSLLLIGLGALVALSQADGSWAFGFAIAGVWAVINLVALDSLVRTALVPGSKQMTSLVVVAVVKIPVLYGVGLLVALKGGFPPIALMVGVSVPLAVIVLKVLGRMLATRVALPPRREEGGSPDGDAVGSRVSR